MTTTITFESPNPHFEDIALTSDAATIISKLEHGIEDMPWAEAVIVATEVELVEDTVPTESVMQGVCHGLRRTSNSWQLHCSVANNADVVPTWLGIYANCSMDDESLVFTGKTLVAKCKAKDPCVFNADPDAMKKGPDKVFSFQIRANVTDMSVDTLTTMQERSHDLDYKVVTEGK